MIPDQMRELESCPVVGGGHDSFAAGAAADRSATAAALGGVMGDVVLADQAGDLFAEFGVVDAGADEFDGGR
jgi:hypothetical protein